jgi:hypothetical protein
LGARRLNDALVLGAQRRVRACIAVGAHGGAFGLRELTLLEEAYARELRIGKFLRVRAAKCAWLRRVLGR